MAAQRLLSSADHRRRRTAPPRWRRATRSNSASLETLRGGRPDRLHRLRPSLCQQRRRSARWIASIPSGSTDAPGGFSEPTLAALRRLVPVLALAIKCAVARAHRRDAGRDLSRPRCRPAGARAAASRAASPTGSAPCCGSRDLRGYTTITDTAPPDEIIPLLNDYAEAVISADPRGRRRRAEADRRRHARDLQGRRSGPGLPLRAARRGAAAASASPR